MNTPIVSAPHMLGKLTLTEWLEERANNCARIYKLKDDGADKALWREDEAYFRAAVKACKALEQAGKHLEQAAWHLERAGHTASAMSARDDAAESRAALMVQP